MAGLEGYKPLTLDLEITDLKSEVEDVVASWQHVYVGKSEDIDFAYLNKEQKSETCDRTGRDIVALGKQVMRKQKLLDSAMIELKALESSLRLTLEQVKIAKESATSEWGSANFSVYNTPVPLDYRISEEY